MDENKNSSPLPDISGVFDVDESAIPQGVISPDTDSASLPKDYAPILLSADQQGKAEEKQIKAKKKAAALDKKRKSLKKKLILSACIAVAVLTAIFGIKYAVDLSKRPSGEIAASFTGTISSHYDTKALLYSDVVSTGKVKTVAVFSDNDYDLYSVAVGQQVEVYVTESVSVTGKVAKIEQISPESPILEKIREAFPEGEYSSGVNFVITVETELNGSSFENTTTNIRIITARSENTVIIPSSALRKDGNSSYVWVYKSFSKTLKKTPVTVGISSDDCVEITEGLKSGTKVVLSFDREESLISDSMKIKVTKKDAE